MAIITLMKTLGLKNQVQVVTFHPSIISINTFLQHISINNHLCRQNKVRLKGAILQSTGAEINPLLYLKLDSNKSIKPCVVSEMLNQTA